MALAFFTFVKAYTRENGFASGTSDAKPFFTRSSVSCEAFLPAAEPARFGRERTGAAALAKRFFGDGGGVADRPAVEPVGPGCGKKPFKQQAIGIGKLVGVGSFRLDELIPHVRPQGSPLFAHAHADVMLRVGIIGHQVHEHVAAVSGLGNQFVNGLEKRQKLPGGFIGILILRLIPNPPECGFPLVHAGHDQFFLEGKQR